jgi:N-acetyl-alpha-D-muramate 1-phosphate uridylyltransferase
MKIESAMILAAGLGKRMLPLTANKPKPLIEVAGKRLIDYAADALGEASVSNIVVNAHYFADQIESWAKTKPEVTISDERDALLETGGGIAKALPLLDRKPFFVMNGDGFWMEQGTPALQRLAEAWRDDDMDSLLLVTPLQRTTGFEGRGDFTIDAEGRLTRLTAPSPEAVVYIGAYVVHPRLFAEAPRGAFSMNLLWSRAVEHGRLYGLIHAGHWFHVGTPEAVSLAEKGMALIGAT